MKRALLPLMLLSALLLGACTPQAASPAPAPTGAGEPIAQTSPAAQYHNLGAAAAKARMDSGEPIIILDVRTQSEFDGGHIKGAVLLPNETINTQRPDILPDLDAEILVYCRSGSRSRQAAMKLVAMGYTNVHDFGGVMQWPYDLVTE